VRPLPLPLPLAARVLASPARLPPSHWRRPAMTCRWGVLHLCVCGVLCWLRWSPACCCEVRAESATSISSLVVCTPLLVLRGHRLLLFLLRQQQSCALDEDSCPALVCGAVSVAGLVCTHDERSRGSGQCVRGRNRGRHDAHQLPTRERGGRVARPVVEVRCCGSFRPPPPSRVFT
jgi:hypothetical protein